MQRRFLASKAKIGGLQVLENPGRDLDRVVVGEVTLSISNKGDVLCVTEGDFDHINWEKIAEIAIENCPQGKIR